MSSPNAFRDRVKQLEGEMHRLQKTLNNDGSESSLSFTTMISCAVPVLVLLGLYSFSPSIVMEDDNGKQVRSTKKLLMWSTVITIVILGGIYGYNAYKGAGASSLIGTS